MALDDELLSRKEVRLFPSHHIRSDREAELRATASFLSVTRAVSEFGRAVVSMAGGPKGKILCYTEVPFKVQTGAKPGDEDQPRPDGLLRVTRGKKDWTAIIEVKVGNNSLEQEQFDCYHTIADDHGINTLVTISNQPALANGLPPGVKPDAWRLKRVPVVHLSWERLLGEAQLLSRQKAVVDSDQQWILDEWVRYLADPHSRIIEPPQIGAHWSEVLQYAREGNLSACKSQMQDVVERWNAFLKKVAFRLRAKLGVDVVLKTSKAESKDPALRIKNLLDTAINDGQLPGVFRIPDAAGDLSVVVLLAPRTVQYSIEIEAPTESKPLTRIKWLLKQLQSDDVPADVVVQVNWGWRLSSQGQISDLKEKIDGLLWDNNGQQVPREATPRSFSLQWTKGLPKGKGRSTAPVLEGIAQRLEEFYGRVVEGIKPFVPKAPRLQEDQSDKKDVSIGSDKQPENKPEQPAILQGVAEGDALSQEGSLDEKNQGGASEVPAK